ncbi:hypothetical protein NVSP9465_01658 [Novosphingobium sp. CECT 9465]|nr:hypothetical protein NVSP9465_01658 [Novosphingobium sp. CECT 9465]
MTSNDAANLSIWDAAMQTYAEATKAFADQEAITPSSFALDDLCNAMTDAEDALFRLDAPHLRAILWKLDRLEVDANGSSLSPDHIRQVSTDIRRLIGEA